MLGLAIVIICLRTISFLAFKDILENRFRLALLQEMQIHIAELQEVSGSNSEGALELKGMFSDPRYSAARSGFYWQVTTPGQAPLRSGSLVGLGLETPSDAPPDPLGFYMTNGPDGPAMMIQHDSYLSDGRPMRIQMATSETVLQKELEAVEDPRALFTIFFSALLIPLVALVLWLIVKPLRRLRKEISYLDGRQKQIEGRYPPDIQPVIDKLNSVLLEYERLANHARLQAVSLAHNVRSVMVALSDEVEQLEQKYPEEPALHQIRKSCFAIQHQIEFHARRADRPEKRSVTRDSTGLEQLLDYVFQAVHQLHRRNALEWHMGVSPDCIVKCSKRDLGEILFSLLDNAGRWARSKVHCNWHVEDGYCVIEIDDDGPGFAATSGDSRTAAKATPSGGLGLGLEISRELTEANGGRLDYGMGPLGGARVLLRLPLATKPSA